MIKADNVIPTVDFVALSGRQEVDGDDSVMWVV